MEIKICKNMLDILGFLNFCLSCLLSAEAGECSSNLSPTSSCSRPVSKEFKVIPVLPKVGPFASIVSDVWPVLPIVPKTLPAVPIVPKVWPVVIFVPIVWPVVSIIPKVWPVIFVPIV